MSFQFKHKTVYILSPEKWGVMKVSKHHYALELADMGCRVFFIEPSSLSSKGITINNCVDHSLIKIVNYKPIYRGKRFLPSFIFSFLLKFQAFLLIKKISIKPDVVWSFHAYLFENLKWFGAPVNIFFAADQFSDKHLPKEIDSADIVIAVSDTIFEKIKKAHQNVFQINHGLIKSFAISAEENLKNNLQNNSNTKKVVAGYVGNLRMQAMDTKTMKEVIEKNVDIDFVFWGSYKKDDLNLGGVKDEATNSFISFLEKTPHVSLRGPLNSTQLQAQMKEANLFWFCYDTESNAMWDGSNSHKILEYLSTGCPVVSHYVSFYNKEKLLAMLPSKSNDGYLQLFKQTIANVKKGEDRETIEMRLNYALANKYDLNIQKIESFVATTIKQ
jgi:glycosyltransferase involved in cell wall biosynthesis